MTVADKPSSRDALRICPNCGAWVRRERTGCPWCGTNLQGTPSTTSSQVVTEGAEATADPGRDDLLATSLSVTFWRRLFLIVAGVLALLFVVMGALAVYQGLNDRAAADARSAIDHYERGRATYEEGRCELAAAEFREALRLKPDFDAARQALSMAETCASDQTGAAVQPLPTPAETKQLWAEAVEAYNAEDYATAADRLEQIVALDPKFRTDEVEELLFDSYVTMGRAAATDGNFDEAVRAFDRALALRPDNGAMLRERQLASAYNRGIEALEEENWELATTEFRRVYILDSSYHDVVDKLAEAHRRYGDEFFTREIWCDAAEQYRESDSVDPDSNVADRAATAESRCSRRVTAPEVAPTAVTAVVTETRTVTATRTPVPGDYGFVAVDAGEVDFSEACTGHYIKGRVLNEDEAPLVGITIKAVDQWGNQYTAQSKSEPPGSYDMPVNSIETSYDVFVIGADGEQASRTLSVTHDASLATSDRACHVITWQRVRSEG